MSALAGIHTLSTLQRHTRVLQYGKKYHVCVLYCKSDKTLEWVQKIVRDLEDMGFICYYHDRNMLPGELVLPATLQSLRKSLKILIILNQDFIQSRMCMLDLYYAIHENLSRDEHDNPDALIPIRLELCDIPPELQTFKSLDVFDEKVDWWEILIQTVDSESNCMRKLTEVSCIATKTLENAATCLAKELKKATTKDLNTFLIKPIALDLSQFLNQSNTMRSFHLAMKTIGINISGDTLFLSMSVFKDFASRPYQMAHILRQNINKMPAKIIKVGLKISDESGLLNRDYGNEVHQFNQMIRTILKARSDHYLTGIMYNVEGIPKNRKIRDKCRFLIHDAVVEEISENIAHPKYDSFEARLATFKKWLHDMTPSKEQLAQAGYFCEENGIIFRCFYCNGVDWDFKPYENPWKRHAKWYYNCPFVKANQTQKFIFESRFKKGPSRETYNPRYENIRDRIMSFQNWAHNDKPHAFKMADAGLYFTRLEDKVCCYYCGHGFRNWEHDADPWFRHALMSPECAHVQKHKPMCFLSKVRMEAKKIHATESVQITYSIESRNAQ